jgi:hypothetical protein
MRLVKPILGELPKSYRLPGLHPDFSTGLALRCTRGQHGAQAITIKVSRSSVLLWNR